MSWLFLYLLTGTVLTCGAQEYYVTPTPPPNTNCPSHKPCHTLDYYARNASDLISGRENVSLLFLSGYHNSETVFEIANVDVLTIAGLDLNFDLQNPSTKISSTRMLISNGTVFTVKNIAISSVSVNVNDFQIITNNEIVCGTSNLILTATQVNSVLLSNSALDQCQWSLYWGYSDDGNTTSAIGISTISDTTPSVEISNTDVYSESSINMRLARSGNTSVNLNVSFCSFLDTNGLIINAQTVIEHLSGSDLVITMDHCSMTDDLVGLFINALKTHNVHLEISDFNFTALANDSKAIQLIVTGSTINATVENSNFLGGLGVTVPVDGRSKLSLKVHECYFMKAGLDSIRIQTKAGKIDALIEDCQFINGLNLNSNLILEDRVILVHSLQSLDTPQIVLRNLLIQNNHFMTGIVHLLGKIQATVDNCTFKDNSATVSGGLLSFYSNITFTGNTIFENNTGAAGGAIYLFESILIFAESLNLVFINNKAETTGGAIFVTETRAATFGDELVQFVTNPTPKCIYQLENTNNSTLPSITFINNTAQSGGDNIYGAALKDACTVTPNTLTRSYEIQETLFDFQPVSESSVSSFSRRVCACEYGKPKCTDIDYVFMNKSVTPGETLSLDVMVVGYDFGSTTGEIHATNITNTGATVSTLKSTEEIQLLSTNKNCTTVNYSVTGNINSTIKLILTSSRFNAETIIPSLDLQFSRNLTEEAIEIFNKLGLITTSLLYTPLFVSIDLLPCPIGLELDSSGQGCICNSELINEGLVSTCTVESNEIRIIRNMNKRAWFRIRNDSNQQLIFEYGFSCLSAYCTSEAGLVNPRYPDSQCANNHSGVLCGGCAEGLSLALGSARCLECPDNAPVSLILLFLLLGVLLVLFIWILDLTISRGTINGLLFYVNMVSIHSEIFFIENTEISNSLSNFSKAAKVFIDWCNLDFGIESCFIYGLDVTGKVWLQFLFPLYVWGLAGLIIVACKYSTRLTKLFGNNSVSVLLTLFLIAYMKLVQTIVVSFSYANIITLNSTSDSTRWLLDGNIKYSDVYHVILCIFSGILAIFVFLFTVWLLLIRLSKRLPNHHKIDPIIDSYTGRLNKNHEYWIGLSLIARVFFAIGTIVLSRDTILRIMITVLFIFDVVVSHVYKKIYLSLLEIAFMLNLLIVSAIFVEQTNNELLAISISVSVLISALMFVGICIYHGVKLVKRIRPKVAKYLYARRETKRKIEEAMNEQQENKPPSLTVVNLNSVDNEMSDGQNKTARVVANYSNYREELLDSTEL